MIEKSKEKCPNLKYAVCDVFNMTYEPRSFDLILDKGCLDAIYPELNEENKANIDKFFKDTWKIVKAGGSYLVISLFQDYILEHLIDFFTR